MTKLDCTVRNCRYNEDKCCCRGHIEVEGAKAKESPQTCCGSFSERGSDSYTNAVGEPSKDTAVQCKAQDCIHNESRECKASSIDISGRNACCCGETECGTFECK